ncbi:uncharacterized protein LOC119639056 [Glossina fuscipes]|uniref:Uncharacterized protein LOC119639056 n=1 Tax=Glossina fuscipes TaxID=7396 RepID=A0A9C5Z315_9MUSC|nr:uncharacterized protein LOC119639056 [Glossina fuscipes]
MTEETQILVLAFKNSALLTLPGIIFYAILNHFSLSCQFLISNSSTRLSLQLFFLSNSITRHYFLCNIKSFLLIPVDKTSSYFPSITNNNSDESNSLDSKHATDYDCGGDPLNCTSSGLSSEFASSSSTSTENCSQPATTLPVRPYSIASETLVQVIVEQQRNTNGNSEQSKSLDSVATVTPEEKNRCCINEFLNKIDNTISESHKCVEKSREK